ncbi:hypothetical protein U1Q18_027832, partial [Sarracenia purpurea var. burkii]
INIRHEIQYPVFGYSRIRLFTGIGRGDTLLLCPSPDLFLLARLAQSRLFHLLPPILAVACRSEVGVGGRGRWRRRGLVHHLPPLPIASLPLLWYLPKLLVWACVARSVWPKT